MFSQENYLIETSFQVFSFQFYLKNLTFHANQINIFRFYEMYFRTIFPLWKTLSAGKVNFHSIFLKLKYHILFFFTIISFRSHDKTGTGRRDSSYRMLSIQDFPHRLSYPILPYLYIQLDVRNRSWFEYFITFRFWNYNLYYIMNIIKFRIWMRRFCVEFRTFVHFLETKSLILTICWKC